MLSSDLLSQLSELKKDIRSNRDLAVGIVRGTSGKFGFVSLEDGREAFLNPEQMERVLPGDKVEVEVSQNDKEQYEAKLEKFISSPVSYLCGRYQIRGKGHFIATDGHNFSRWIFIPPKFRKNCADGDYVSAKLSQHPFKEGRAQAKITERIGNQDTAHIERLYTLKKFQLEPQHDDSTKEAAANLCGQDPDFTQDQQGNTRQDLRDLAFVTIDSAGTKDMDDALAIKINEEGWELYVAIADPGGEIKPDSKIDQAAGQRCQTSYFPDAPLPMLLESLSQERYSLKPDTDRLALVFHCNINKEGDVTSSQFIPAVVRSHAKLSYQHVAALLDNKPYKTTALLSDPADHKVTLEALQQCTNTLNQQRQQNHIVISNRPDFAFYLNEKGKLQSIEKIERTCAHTIIEEAMLLTNRYAGDFLAEHQAGLFVHHQGFREERRKDIEALLSEKTDTEISATNHLDNYIQTIKTLQSKDEYANLLLVQQHFLEPSHLSSAPQPHFGLGFKHYATVTSPIRRYQDMYNQRAIHNILAKTSAESTTPDQLDSFQVAIKASRNASQFMGQWLVCDFMKDKIGQTFSATVSLLTNQGIGVRLDDTGIEGFVPAKKADRKNPDKAFDKISFNNQRMELSWNGNDILLSQTVEVKLARIDHDRKKLEFTFV